MPGILKSSTRALLVVLMAGLGVTSISGQTPQAPQAPQGGRQGGGRQAGPPPPPYVFPQGFTLVPTPEPQPGTADPGVMFTTLMNRPEVRILRVEIQPGAVRRVHTHEDVTFHLLMPLTGPLQVTAGTETVEAKVGQAYFMLKSMPHSFTNTGKTPVLVIETFVKPEPKPAAGGNAAEGAWAMALAALSEVSR
jgi:mannose-6-phosphate isomerase-like protein (cupin superfamily)